MAVSFESDVDLKGALLLNGSAGTAGQIPYSAGPGAPAVWTTLAKEKSITIESPTATEKIIMLFTTAAITVSQIRSVIIGGTNVTFSIRYGTDVSAAGTEVVTSGVQVTSTTTGLSTTSFNSASIAANRFVWITTSAVTGSVTQLAVTVVF